MTARPAGHGLLDFDIAYHDPRDLSYDAENGVIQRHLAGAVDFAGPVELRNQARVHMWYPEKFGHAYPALDSVEDGLRLYPARTQAVAVRINERKRIEIIAPFGLGPIFSFRFLPNDALPNATTYSRKAARCLELWPELQVSPWPGRPSVLASGK